MKNYKSITLAVAFGAVWLVIGALGAYAQSVGVNFVSSGDHVNNTDMDALAPADSAGAPGFVQANWNNLGRYGDSVTLNDSTGTATSLLIEWDSADQWHTGAGQSTPDYKLMDGVLLNSGPADPLTASSVYGAAGDDKPLVYIGGMQAWLASHSATSYKIVLYVAGDHGYWGVGEHWIQAVSGNPTWGNMVPGADLTPHLFVTDTGLFNGTYTQVSPACTTSANSSTTGNYMVFSGLTNDAVLLRISSGGWQAADLMGFQIIPAYPSAPTVTTPTIAPSATVYSGVPVTLTEIATGDPSSPALYYQWQSDNGNGGPVNNNILNATNATVTVTPTNAPFAYTINYQVIVTNTFGATTSSVVTLTVNPGTAPLLTQDIQPGTSVFAYANGSLTFSAGFDGTQPFQCQWQTNSGSGYSSLVGATNASLTLTNLPLSAAGSYILAVTNLVGNSASSAATLTVLADPALPDPSEPYAYAVLTNQPVGYWRLSETADTVSQSIQAYDSSGNNLDGTYGHGVTDNQSGPQHSTFPGFEPGNTGATFFNNANGSSITVPSLNLNTNTVTITAWINPNTVAGTYWGLFTWANGNDKAGLGFGGTLNGNGIAELGYTWNTNSPSSYNFNSNLYPLPNQWNFVALVITPTNSTIYLYNINSGVVNLSKSIQTTTNGPESFSGGTIRIGSDTYDGRDFNGTMDEVAVFNKSMSEAQIQNLFLIGSGISGSAPSITADISPTSVNTFAGQRLQLTAAGDGAPVPVFQWQAGTTGSGVFTNLINAGRISGVNSSTLTINNTTPADALDYRLVLTNINGSAVSSVATVTLTPIPASGPWTVNFAIVNGANGTSASPYSGPGILGTGTYWNALTIPGNTGGFRTTAPVYQDDGVSVSGISANSTMYNAGWANGSGTGSVALLGPYAEVSGNNLQFANVPNGTYNLALYGVDGNYQDQGCVFTVNGVVQSTTGGPINQFTPGVNSVVFSAVSVTNGTLTVICSNNIVANPSQSSGAFNGVQLQLAQAAGNPSQISSVQITGGNLVIKGTSLDAGESYRVLSTTNLALPLTDWTTVVTSTFAPGGFTNSIPVDSNKPQSFYRVVEP